ncbi:hypothetical protein BDP27DRAFT_1378173 [Rhodocollybia butyracea]|uniref:Uncharacterized protein n=1 Tax=Rhodocollybia butyracea TaxID=206335 RepID=A0A9P5TWE1_9AGAR|nr:hypothetical protein BDP27DRAFT_1378173 [Rhodocollybia butyracea]
MSRFGNISSATSKILIRGGRPFLLSIPVDITQTQPAHTTSPARGRTFWSITTPEGAIQAKWTDLTQNFTGTPYIGIEIVPGSDTDKPFGRPVVDPASSEKRQVLAQARQQEWDGIWDEYSARYLNEDFVVLDGSTERTAPHWKYDVTHLLDP